MMCSHYRITVSAVVYLLYCLLSTAGEEVVRLQELEGNTVIIHTGLTAVQTDAQILWFYGPENADIIIVNSLDFEGKINTKYYRNRFSDRLQLDRSSASLTIRNIRTEDSGLYKLEIITQNRSVWSFSVKVYASVSKPVIKNHIRKRTGSLRESCSPLCSVENSKDVNLFWYKDKERISSISSTDSSDHLHLPLNITHTNYCTYTCVAANPVSNQTAKLNITELCELNTDQKKESPKTLAAILIPVGLFMIFLSLLLFWCRGKNRKQKVSKDPELTYVEVATKPQNSREAQKGKSAEVTEDQTDSVVYSSVNI